MLRYSGVDAYDSTGTPLDARMSTASKTGTYDDANGGADTDS